jgi:hypothetical protein
MHLIHRGRNTTTDITIVDRHLTFSRIIDSKLATINKTITERTTVLQLTKIVENACSLENDMFSLVSEHSMTEDELREGRDD